MMRPVVTEPPAADASSPVPVRLSWLHPAGLVSLGLANLALRILTLNVYHFWGETEVRRRIWSAVRLEGEPLVYTGTGRELFAGFLVVFGLVLLPLTLTGAAAMALPDPGSSLIRIALSAFVFYLTGVAVYRARRYRLSRTRWRGIRMSLGGNSWRFGWTYVWTLALPFGVALFGPGFLAYALTGGDRDAMAEAAGPTIGTTVLAMLAAFWILPWRSIKLQGLLVRDMRFGDRPFTFDAPAGPLYRRYAAFWAGSAVIAAWLCAALLGAATPEALAGLTDETDTEKMANALRFVVLATFALGLAYLLYYLVSASYRAFQFNHFASHTHFEGASFRGTATGRGLVRNALGNFLLWLAGFLIGLLALLGWMFLAGTVLALPPESAGGQAFLLLGLFLLFASMALFRPLIQARTTGYLARNLAIDGKVPLAGISQGDDHNLRRGEGLAQAFDVDAF